MINFLPTILNQLFRVLTGATHEEVAVNVTRQASPSVSTIKLCDHRSTHGFSYEEKKTYELEAVLQRGYPEAPLNSHFFFYVSGL